MKVTLEREGKNIVKMGIELEPDKVSEPTRWLVASSVIKCVSLVLESGKAPRMIIEKTIAKKLSSVKL